MVDIGSVGNDRFEIKFESLSDWNPLDRKLRELELEYLSTIIKGEEYNLKLNNGHIIGDGKEVKRLYDNTKNSVGRHGCGMYLINKKGDIVFKDKAI